MAAKNRLTTKTVNTRLAHPDDYRVGSPDQEVALAS